MCFGYLFESPHRGDSNKYTKHMIIQELLKNICFSSFLKAAKFDLTAKSLVTKHCRYNEGPLYYLLPEVIFSLPAAASPASEGTLLSLSVVFSALIFANTLSFWESPLAKGIAADGPK